MSGAPESVGRTAGRLPVFVLVLLVAAGAGAQEAPGTLVGRVEILRLSGEPAAATEGVRLELAGGGPARVIVTGPGGLFRFDGLTPGVYSLTGQQVPRFVGHSEVVVAAGQETRLVLRLATMPGIVAATAMWCLLILVVTGAFCAGMMLYGGGRTPKQRSAPRSLTVSLILWIGAYALLRALAPEMQPILPEVAGGVAAVSAVLLAGCLVILVVELQPPWPAALGALLAGLTLSLVLRTAAVSDEVRQVGAAVGLLLWATAAGWLLSLGLRQHAHLVLAAWVIAVGDVFSVFFGLTGAVASGQATGLGWMMDLGSLAWPVPGTELVQGLVGAGDFLFLAWFLAAAQRFGLGVVRTYWVLMAAFTIGITMTHTLWGIGLIDTGLPALPFLSVLFLLANRGQLTVSRADRRLISGFVTVAVVAAMVVAAVRGRNPAPPETVVLESAAPGDPVAAPRAPWDLAALAATPFAVRLGPPQAEGQVVVESVSYPVGAGAGGTRTATGWLARPTGRAPLAGVLCLPDVGRPGDRLAAIHWARLGYLCLSLGWSPVSDGEPDLEQVFRVTPVVARSVLYEGGAAVLRAVRFLAERPDVTQVAVAGDELGGLLAVIAGSIEPAVGAVIAANVGRAEGDLGRVGRYLARQSSLSRERWLESFGARQYAAAGRRPSLFLVPANSQTYSLAGSLDLYRALGTRDKCLVVLPNASHYPKPLCLGQAARWLEHAFGGSGAPIGEPEVELGTDNGALRLSVPTRRVVGAERVTFHLTTGAAPTPGSYWTAVPAERRGGEWLATVAVSAPAAEVDVVAEAVTSDGWVACSTIHSLHPEDLGLVLEPPPWPTPVLGSFGAGTDGWRVAEDLSRRLGLDCLVEHEALTVAYPEDLHGSQPVVLETNRTAALRSLGAQVRELVVGLDPGSRPARLTLSLVERYGTDAERRFTAVVEARAGRNRASVPLSWFRGPGTARDIVWPAVDALVLSTTTDADRPLRLYGVTLVGRGGEGVRPVASP